MTELSSKEIARLKAEAQSLDSALQVGKAGVSEGVVEEVSKHLERDVLVKLKLLRSALEERDRHEVARELAERVDATLVEVRGHTVVLYRPPRSRRARRPRPE